ncbi:MAG: YbaY family lipoprotein [Bryobacteraceae bacterium]|nr:YbaY family lipoprotein [Bryobacteraceae bacterium]
MNRVITGLALVVAILAGCARTVKMESPAPKLIHVSGSVSYRERMALPPNALVDVRLVDTSAEGGPAEIARDVIEAAGKQPPYAYSLSYHPREIVAEHNYVVQAQIAVEGRVWFQSQTPAPVITKNNPITADLVLARASQNP